MSTDFSVLPVEERTVLQGETGTWSTTVNDDGTPIALASVSTLVCTAREWCGDTGKAGRLVNSRDAQDVKNANNGTYHATSGLFTFAIQAGDTNPVRSANEPEVHRFEFVLTTTGSKVKKFYLDVVCLPGALRQ